MRLVHVVSYRVGVVGETLLKFFVAWLSFGNAFNETCYFLMPFVLPRISLSPVVVEITLHYLHLFYCRLFGVFLHACINGSINLKSTGIEVESVFFAPVVKIVGYCLAEILRLTVIAAFDAVVQLYGHILQRVVKLA